MTEPTFPGVNAENELATVEKDPAPTLMKDPAGTENELLVFGNSFMDGRIEPYALNELPVPAGRSAGSAKPPLRLALLLVTLPQPLLAAGDGPELLLVKLKPSASQTRGSSCA